MVTGAVLARCRRVPRGGAALFGSKPVEASLISSSSRRSVSNWSTGGDRVVLNRLAVVVVDHGVHWGVGFTLIGLATRGIMMIESCKVIEPIENQIPVGWNG